MTGRELKAGTVLATAELKLTGTGYDGKPYEETVHAELAVSGAFKYGNQTCMAFTWENGQMETFDTRYEPVTVENFEEYASEVLDSRTLDTIEVTIM